jgi:hypothetical protein
MLTVGSGILREHSKSWKIRNAYCRTWNMARYTEKHGKGEMQTVRPGIW